MVAENVVMLSHTSVRQTMKYDVTAVCRNLQTHGVGLQHRSHNLLFCWFAVRAGIRSN